MLIQCGDIETLTQSYLDNELTEGDAREFETHASVCEGCRNHLESEAEFHRQIRQQLTAPKAPMSLQDAICHSLDREDWNQRKSPRRSNLMILPIAATMAAAAALMVFVTASSSPQVAEERLVASDAVRQHMRRPPIEVQGTAVSPWVQKHYNKPVQVPRFNPAEVRLRGGRLSHIQGRDALQFYYDVALDRRRHEVSLLAFNADNIDFGSGFDNARKRTIGSRDVWVGESKGYGVVALKGPLNVIYLFTSAKMTGEHLFDVVRRSDLLSTTSPN